MLEGALVAVGASVVASLVGFMVVTDAVIEGPEVVEVAVADRVDIEYGRIRGMNEVLCPDTPVKV